MIDTKIACQCGNRFKFGMDLVNGRAPDGLVCPTCGAPATPACNALVDFLAGKEPPPLAAGSRPLKEIRVACACGARYKFDLELPEQEMPGAVTCPACQADLTATANAEIRSYIAKHPLNADAPAATPAPAAPELAAPAPAPTPAQVAAPAPTPVAAPATPPPPAPAAAQPVLPPPVAVTVATAASDATLAAPAPPAPTPPPDATAATATPPAPAAPAPTAAPASAATPPPAAAPAEPGAIATPIEDPFGPAPATKTSGPNLKPLEVPRPNRPPPGSRPATPPASGKPAAPAAPGTPAAAASTAAKPAAGKPEAGKPGAKPAAKPAAKAASREPNFNLGVGGAVGGAVIGAIIWFVLLKTTPMTASWMAVVVGLLSGGAARLLGRGGSANLGKISCISSAVAIGLMIWMGMLRHSDRQAEKLLDTQYQQAVKDAKDALQADDTQLRAYIARTRPSADLEGNLITAADIQKFRATELPKLKDRAAGTAADKAKFYADRIAAYRSAQAWDEVWQETFGIFGLLLALAGVMAPAKLAGE